MPNALYHYRLLHSVLTLYFYSLLINVVVLEQHVFTRQKKTAFGNARLSSLESTLGGALVSSSKEY